MEGETKMKNTHIFIKQSALLEEDFKLEINDLLAAKEETINIFIEHFNSSHTLEELLLAKNWVPLAEKTGEPIDYLFKLFRPIRYINVAAKRANIDPSTLIDLLEERKIIDGTREGNKQRILALSRALKRHTDASEEGLAPQLPGLRIRSISTNTNAMPIFEKDFDITEDDPSKYTDRIRKLYFYTTLIINFRSRDPEKVTIALSEADLKDLMKWLQMAEVQQNILKKSLTKGSE